MLLAAVEIELLFAGMMLLLAMLALALTVYGFLRSPPLADWTEARRRQLLAEAAVAAHRERADG